MEQYGIESTKSLLAAIFDVARVGVSLDADGNGKITTGEIFSAITGGLIFKIAPLYAAIPEVKKEAKDYSPEEIEELVAFASAYDILPEKHDDLERFIKDTLNMINYNMRYVNKAKSFFKKKES